MRLRDLVLAYAIHPAIHAYVVLGGISGVAAFMMSPDFWSSAAAVATVIIIYPFAEYGTHRFILHGRYLYKSRLTAALWKRIHFDHHQDPNRLDVLFGSPANTLPAIAVATLPTGWMVGGPGGAAAAFSTGTVIMCVYEFAHCLQHLNYQPRSPYLKRLKRHHLAHHFHDESGNYGITSSLVDRICGTHYGCPQERPRSSYVFNLGYGRDEAQQFPWVADLSSALPRNRPTPSGKAVRRPPKCHGPSQDERQA